MPKLTKQISKMIDIPETWEHNPLDEDGKPINEKPKTYELGGGKIKIFSMDKEAFANVRDFATTTTFSGGSVTVLFSELDSLEGLFSERCGHEKGSWVGFTGRDGEALNSNTKNQKSFAHLEGLNLFVTSHIGPMLDKMANDEATEEEKNLLASLSGQAGDATESTPEVAEVAKKPGPKK